MYISTNMSSVPPVVVTECVIQKAAVRSTNMYNVLAFSIIALFCNRGVYKVVQGSYRRAEML